MASSSPVGWCAGAAVSAERATRVPATGVRGQIDFDRVYAEHAAEVTRTAAMVLGETALAEDVAQEVFLALWRGGGYDERRGPLGPYLRMVSRSRALDLWRHNRASERTRAQLQQTAAVISPAAEPPQVVCRAADCELTRRRVRRLPDEQRQVIGLTYWGDVTVQQAAELQGIPIGTAKSRVRLALLKLARDPHLPSA